MESDKNSNFDAVEKNRATDICFESSLYRQKACGDWKKKRSPLERSFSVCYAPPRDITESVEFRQLHVRPCQYCSCESRETERLNQFSVTRSKTSNNRLTAVCSLPTYSSSSQNSQHQNQYPLLENLRTICLEQRTAVFPRANVSSTNTEQTPSLLQDSVFFQTNKNVETKEKSIQRLATKKYIATGTFPATRCTSARLILCLLSLCIPMVIVISYIGKRYLVGLKKNDRS